MRGQAGIFHRMWRHMQGSVIIVGQSFYLQENRYSAHENLEHIQKIITFAAESKWSNYGS